MRLSILKLSFALVALSTVALADTPPVKSAGGASTPPTSTPPAVTPPTQPQCTVPESLTITFRGTRAWQELDTLINDKAATRSQLETMIGDLDGTINQQVQAQAKCTK